jgi:heme oxygenase
MNVRSATRVPAPPTIRDLLREGTRVHHARAEARMPLMDDALTLDGYRETLARLLGFYDPLEARLAGADWRRIGLDPERRRKSQLLVADLQALGVAPARIAGLPRCADLPDARSLAGALGCLYVVEGATLGGQLVRRHVAARLGLGPQEGCAFFTSYGAAVGPMWREYQDRLAIVVEAGDAAADDVVHAARQTFDALTRWLDFTEPAAGTA